MCFFVAGLNIDVAARAGQQFPLTKFVPWAAYEQLLDGRRLLLEQAELFGTLTSMPSDNPDRMSFDTAVAAMAAAEEVELPLEWRVSDRLDRTGRIGDVGHKYMRHLRRVGA
ncbi:MAG TPA: hypothetical protein VKI44_28570 [Acetobacteraceae bacterium]|nr:hypothetical protein [Acetobacteraceae bacterium]